MNKIEEKSGKKETTNSETLTFTNKTKETQESRAFTNDTRVTVCVRKKPIDPTNDVVYIEDNILTVQNNKLSYSLDDILCSHQFQFDKVYGGMSTNTEIFTSAIKQIVDHTLSGGSSSVIAYGQTGTGKTYSLLNPSSGIIFESIKYILENGFKGSISFIEIYLGHVQDCLKGKAKLNIFEKDGCIYASELCSKSFETFEEATVILSEALKNRTTAHTDGNNYSSRSHAVLFIDVYKKVPEVKKGPRKLASNSTFVLVDLAGSERGTDRKSGSKESAAEGAEINKSLLALKECIRGIEMNSKFLPFRQSKLTQLLKNSFVGESKLLFLATISANGRDVEHTLNTLRYAIRIKESNGSGENEEVKHGEVKIYGENKLVQRLEAEKQAGMQIDKDSFVYYENNTANATEKERKQSIETKELCKDTHKIYASAVLTAEELTRLKDLSIQEKKATEKCALYRKNIREMVNNIILKVETHNDELELAEITQSLKQILQRIAFTEKYK